MLEFIDSHCHLVGEHRPPDADAIILKSIAAGTKAMVCVSTQEPDFLLAKSLAEKYPEVFFSVGHHPHEASPDGDLALLKRQIEAFTDHPKCVAIGETGLDAHYDHSLLANQIQTLKLQLTIAANAGLPVIIHSREAEAALLPLLTEYAAQQKLSANKGVIHCFTGTREFAEACIALGFYISLSGILTFKNAEALRVIAAALPLDRLLVETDSPFLAPVPHRGKPAEPWMTLETAKCLAALHKVPVETVLASTIRNTERLFFRMRNAPT